MIDRLNAWLLVVAALIGIGSVGATTVLVAQANQRTDKQVCETRQSENAATRSFLADLLSDPRTPAAERIQVEGIALKHFPTQKC